MTGCTINERNEAIISTNLSQDYLLCADTPYNAFTLSANANVDYVFRWPEHKQNEIAKSVVVLNFR